MQNKNKVLKYLNEHWQLLVKVSVFLLVIVLMWYSGFKLFGGRPSAGPGDSENKESEIKGQAVSTPFNDPKNYPVIVMIDNSPEARPYHAGLSPAAVVYETLAEGGSTRLAPVFAGPPEVERIGPVRSARPYFVQLAAGWGGFFWHAGGSPEGLALLKELVGQKQLINLNEISGLGPIYLWRDRSLAAPHNLFTSGEKIAKALADFELTSPDYYKLSWQWEKEAKDKASREQAEKATGEASQITVTFSPGVIFNPSYQYDAASGLYQRSLAGRPHLDYNNKEQLAAATVIVQKVPGEWFLPSGYDRIGINIVGEGEALFFRDGKAFAGKWKKETPESQTQWFMDDKPFILKTGQAWVEIVPGSREVKYN